MTDANGKKRKTVASSRDAGKSEQRRFRRQKRGTGLDGADWGSVDAEIVLRTIEVIASTGCASMWGYTRDGGAYSIRIVGDGEPYNEYVRPTENVEKFLNELIEDFSQAAPI